jgi:PBP1b-binding outer membrane lipoprotein LpoB
VAGTLPPDAFLALRTEPSGSHGQRIVEMPNGTMLEVIERRPDNWWFVKVVDTGQTGWALSQQGNRRWIHCCVQENAQSGMINRNTQPAMENPPVVDPGVQGPQQTAVSSAHINTIDGENAAAINKRIGDLGAQIEILTKVVGEQSELKENASIEVHDSAEQTIAALNARIEKLKKEYTEKDKHFSTYLTSVQPNDRDLYLTARRASEIYAKIPYYIPGTKEIGEFWIEPTVTDKGELLFGFKFVDTEASVEKVRGKIDMTLAEMEDAQKALLKLHEWSEIAHSQNVRKNYEKRVICFPVKDCPPDGERLDGKSSTEIRFNVYEDGSTAGRIQRNKGLFVEGYNVSIDSALMLQAYLNHVIKAAQLEFHSGMQNKKQLDEIFK